MIAVPRTHDLDRPPREAICEGDFPNPQPSGAVDDRLAQWLASRSKEGGDGC